MTSQPQLVELASLIRTYSLLSTTEAGSGHPTSSLSAADLMTGLLFGGTFLYDVENPDHPNNDRLIFSKGHASPLFYSLWAAAGALGEQELLTLRKFGSPLEGHPTPNFPYVEAATGSLGQGLSIGVGMALNARMEGLSYRTYVLLGDGEMTEGSQWEAIQIASHYALGNLTGIIDVNRLGQCGPTMFGHDLKEYEKRVASFGWKTLCIDGHDFAEILPAFSEAAATSDRPCMIIAKTIKGKGVSFLEDTTGWHGKPLKKEDLEKALVEIGCVDRTIRAKIRPPADLSPKRFAAKKIDPPSYGPNQVSTRKAYGNALKRISPGFPEMVVLDAEVSNSTYSEVFKNHCPERFLEMYIAEQNMVGVAMGLGARGRIPFVSTFAAFLTRAFDQIRMSRYSDANMKICGSHAGVSIGQDGPSQMGLEDIAMFRTILECAVLYPSDAVSTERLVEEAAGHPGMVYIRTTRGDTPVLYGSEERFPIGGSKILRQGPDDIVSLIAAGITLHEALAAHEELKSRNILVRVIDLYSIQPMDTATVRKAAKDTKAIITIEDHFAQGGLGEAVMSALATNPIPVHCLAVRKMPRSGKPTELLDFEEISRNAIVRKVMEIKSVSSEQ
ncbi:MAG: transketolase [Desulfobacteraceae bacterium]|nr:MAG: transketolase [Desulfobacteraceae bacterium]